MKYSSALLKKFISVNDTPENIAKNLILKTCEIEEIIQRQIPDLVVIGYVTEVTKHPDADKLFVCQIDCGTKGTFQILTGGENIVKDSYVPVAIPGCYLPAIDLKIEPRKMRGLDSAGMVCSKQELGIMEDTDQHRIWNLRSPGDDCMQTTFDDLTEKDIGVPLGEKYPRLNEYVFDVENKGLTHRPDLTGHFGLATELNAMYDNDKIHFNKIAEYYQTFGNTNIFETLSKSAKSERNILVQTEKLRTYIVLQINDIQSKSSTFFTRLQLLDIGQQPRSNRVDFSNLFMMISGQPVHFFDADKVNGDIIVRQAKEGEEFVDLFDKLHALLPTDVVICDKDKILALAGVVGGKNSGVTDMTKNILVEIANFDPVAVRKTGTRLGLRTDAELRYEKNINPVFSLYSLLLFLDQLEYYKKDLGMYDIKGLSYYSSQETKSMKEAPISIETNFKDMADYIFGKQVKSFEKAGLHYLEGLGFTVEKSNGVYESIVPLRRSPNDITIPEDIFEEVVRIHGYENVEKKSIVGDVDNVPFGPECSMQRLMEDIFVKEGRFNQVETYAWVEDKLLELFGNNKADLYSLTNPLSVDAPCLRDSLVYNLASYITKNSKFFDDIRIFDIGKIWSKQLDGTNAYAFATIDTPEKYAAYTVGEKYQLGAFIYKKSISDWSQDTLLEAKALLDHLYQVLGIKKDISLKITNLENYHPQKQASIILKNATGKESGGENMEDGKIIGFVGSIHPLLLKSLKLPETASLTYLTLHLDEIIRNQPEVASRTYAFETLQDQILSRDLCFVIDATKSFDGVINAVKSVPEVNNVQIFDLYEGENLLAGKKSISLTIKITGDGQLTTEQINEIMNKTITQVEKNGGILRA